MKETRSNLWTEFNDVINNHDLFFARLLFAAITVALAWLGFAYLTDIPVEATTALIMVWLSVAVVLLFPSLLDRIKKFSFKGFEFELFEPTSLKSEEDFVSNANFGEDATLSDRSSLQNLQALLTETATHPGRPVLLLVNVREQVFIPKLYEYLHFLVSGASQIIVLFIDAEPPVRSFSEIPAESLLKIISGHKVYVDLSRRFPSLRYSVFVEIETGIQYRSFSAQSPTVAALDAVYQGLRDAFQREVSDFQDNSVYSDQATDLDQLNLENVRNWFGGKVDHITFKREEDGPYEEALLKALVNDYSFIAVLVADRLEAIVEVCHSTKEVAIRILQQSSMVRSEKKKEQNEGD